MSDGTSTFTVIAADPPWRHESTPAGGRGAAVNHYPLMSTDDLCAMWPSIWQLSASRSMLALWVPDSMLPDGLRVMAAWGFEYKKVGFIWVKTNQTTHHLGSEHVKRAVMDGDPMLWDIEVRHGAVPLGEIPPREMQIHARARGLWMGMGRTTRNNAEICLFGSTGGMPIHDRGVNQVLFAPLQGRGKDRHSRKPDEYLARLERLWPWGRYLELFARRRRRGWAAWGDQLKGKVSV